MKVDNGVNRLEDLFLHNHDVGQIVRMDYHYAVIATNDYAIHQAGGVPRNCFLLAASVPASGEVPLEAILLRVEGVTELDLTRELRAVREQLASGNNSNDVDPMTKSRMQLSGYGCKIVGTFYEEDGELSFGSDVDRVYAAESYKVFKPYGASLSAIVSYTRGGSLAVGRSMMMDLGVVRYTETRRSVDDEAKVFVDVKDFIGKKTILAGMSRSGKALTAETLLPVPVSEKHPTGWARNDELEIGDQLYSTTSKPTTITNFTEWGVEDVYEIEFHDGQRVRTSEGHLWWMNDSNTVNRVKINSKAAQNVETLRQLQHIISFFDNTMYLPLKDIVELSGLTIAELVTVAELSGVEKHLKITLTDDVTHVDMDYYPVVELLRVMIHHIEDGEVSPARLVTTEELLHEIQCSGEVLRYSVTAPAAVEGVKNQTLHPPYILGCWLSSNTIDESMDVKDELFSSLIHQGRTIPVEHLRSSVEERILLLQGVFDSTENITVEDGYCRYVESDVIFFAQVVEILRSLGCVVKVGKETIDGSEQRSAVFRAGFNVFLHSEKRDLQDTSLTVEDSRIKVANIRKVGEAAMRCVTVDAEDSLHLVAGFIPTHNSNTTKILAQQVFSYSRETDQKIGQIIFDPQGEYANDNEQDKGSLSSLGNGHDVVVYRTRLKGVAYEKQLLLNLLEEENIQLLWDLMLIELENGISAKANYISGLRSVEFVKPDRSMENYNALKHHYQRKRLALYAFMRLAKYNGGVKNLSVNIGKENVPTVVKLHDDIVYLPTEPGEVRVNTVDAAAKLFKWILEQESAVRTDDEEPSILDRLDSYEDSDFEKLDVEETMMGGSPVRTVLSSSWLNDLEDGELAEFKKQFEMYDKGRTGVVSAFQRIKELHSGESSGDIRETVWEDIKKGKLIIVDLSIGSTNVITVLSELIVNSLVQHSSELFTSGQKLIPYQIVVEEAHNLFARTGTKDDSIDPWVRLSKEGAKYQIGLVYGTQEITGVDQRMLSNTSNFIITHLNSQVEVRELSKYYSFNDWSDQIISSESRGFARIKTESSPFVIPVQIAKFDPNAGREN